MQSENHRGDGVILRGVRETRCVFDTDGATAWMMMICSPQCCGTFLN